MTTPQNPSDPVDVLLQAWAGQRQASAAQLENLQERVLAAATAENSDTAAVIQAEPAFRSRKREWSWFGAGAVAASLLVGLAFWMGSRPPTDTAAAGLPPEFAWLQPGQLRDKARVLHELGDMFEERIGWVAETGDRLEFGLTRTEVEATSARPVAVRLVAQQKRPGDADWSVMWALDVVARDEEVVQIPASAAGGADVRLWVYRLPAGEIYLESDLKLPGRLPVQATSAQLLEGGQPLVTEVPQSDGTLVRVYQSAVELPEDVS